MGQERLNNHPVPSSSAVQSRHTCSFMLLLSQASPPLCFSHFQALPPGTLTPCTPSALTPTLP